MTLAGNPLIARLLAKKQATILVTDSGLGGMAIFAEMAARFKSAPIFAEVSLIYYNAWPEQHRGYNALKDMDERVRVFDGALEGMLRYRPDIIMIACNTLSVLYARTAFSRRNAVPVIDIVCFGVDALYERLTANSDASALILGTVTTIASDVHRSRLIEKRIPEARLVGQPCDRLATEIEKGPDSDAVLHLIDGFMRQAAEKLGPNRSELFAALFCTHFGYARDLILTALEKRTHRRVTLIDPNRRMAAFLFEAAGGGRYERTAVALQVVSRIVWEQRRVDAISEIIETRSAESAQALRNYERIPDLFTY